MSYDETDPHYDFSVHVEERDRLVVVRDEYDPILMIRPDMTLYRHRLTQLPYVLFAVAMCVDVLLPVSKFHHAKVKTLGLSHLNGSMRSVSALFQTSFHRVFFMFSIDRRSKR